MIAVIFEVWPRDDQREAYLAAAASLRDQLQQVDGLVSIERFESLSQPGKMLSLSIWRDEQAVQQWRTMAEHRQAQQAGRQGLFHDYRLRVAAIVRDYGLHDRAQAPEDSRQAHGGR